jgi:predicted DNA-binding protein
MLPDYLSTTLLASRPQDDKSNSQDQSMGNPVENFGRAVTQLCRPNSAQRNAATDEKKQITTLTNYVINLSDKIEDKIDYLTQVTITKSQKIRESIEKGNQAIIKFQNKVMQMNARLSIKVDNLDKKVESVAQQAIHL